MSEPLFTVRMLSESLCVPITAVRLWLRSGLLRPSKSVGRLAYFDAGQFQNAKVFAKLYQAGVKAGAVVAKIGNLRRFLPESSVPVHELSIEIIGRELYFRRDGVLHDSTGQRFFAFEPEEESGEQLSETIRFDEADTSFAFLDEAMLPLVPDLAQLCDSAWELEEAGRFEEALALYRAALAVGGPDANISFQIAELLYRQGELAAARERYFMAIEQEEDFVEARANLGCVLAELGAAELAISAFEGALKLHPEYADVHYHLGKTLLQLGRTGEGEYHLGLFNKLMPESPWNEPSSAHGD